MAADLFEKRRVGKLLCHEAPKREQRLFQTDQEQPQAHDNEHEAYENLVHVRDALAQHEQLEHEQE